jgi:hypothetical protein
VAEETKYGGAPGPAWLRRTRDLIKAHPVLSRTDDLLTWIDEAWVAVWSTRVGEGDLSLAFAEIEPRAQIIGEFLESLLALRLSKEGPWRRGSSKEKDLIYTSEPSDGEFAFEIKTSGQATGKIYGNRSYAQPGGDGEIDSPARKKRSGYYLCINFWEDAIFNVRVGWIDPGDWEPQKSPTGQMAGLKDDVYRYKLVSLVGGYCLTAPIFVLSGIGGKSAHELAEVGLSTVGGLVDQLRSHVDVVELEPPSKLEIRSALEALGVDPRTVSRLATRLGACGYFRDAWAFAAAE